MRHFVLVLVAASLATCPAGAAVPDLTGYVNPFIGTEPGAPDFGMGNAAGNTPPGAAYPFGMVLWSPDTTDLAGGYRYSHDTIKGFSLTHISGRGISCYQDVPILPVTGGVRTSPGADWKSYASTFQHRNEAASPGFYSVLLDSGVGVELAVTRRSGMGRFTFPAGDRATILINAGGSAQGNRDAGTGVTLVSSRRVSGSAVSGDCGGWFSYRVYFSIEFSRPMIGYGSWSGDRWQEWGWSAEGGKSGLSATFDTSGDRTVLMKVGLSYVSADHARRNLEAENPGWDIEAVRSTASAAWNARLNSIQVTGGSVDQRTIFYTALYHAFIHPSTFSDADGSYLGFDNVVHNVGSRVQYHNFAGWDIYRSQIPLLALLAPETSDMMQSLVNDAMQDPGGGLPRWQHANTNSGGMIGDSQDAVIATAYAFGARDFDTTSAFRAMETGALNPGATSGGYAVRPGLQEYMTLGYVPIGIPNSGSLTLEYAVEDFCISQFARALGHEEKAAAYLQRSQNWRNLFHDGYLMPRNADGTFPPQIEPWSGLNLVEGSVAQYTFMVGFNMRGLFDLLGGKAAAVKRLDEHFELLNDGPWSEHVFMGNEPSLKTPWAYLYAGAPWKTQQTVRAILLKLFHNAPGGLPGNDDLGTLSAWSVFASLGVYPHTAGVGNLVFGSPIFPEAVMRLASGTVLRLVAPAADPDKPFVRSLTVNGERWNSTWMPWERYSSGAEIEFRLQADPVRDWAASDAAAPPSFDYRPAGK
jgi:predicted alpha-1,2-mannosidase